MNHRAFCYRCKRFTYFNGFPSNETLFCEKCGSADRFDEGVVECIDVLKEHRTLDGRAVKLERQSIVSSELTCQHDKVVGMIDGNYGCTYWDKDGYANGFRIDGWKENLVEK